MNRITFYLLFLIFLYLGKAEKAQAQNIHYKHIVNASAGGAGGYGSLNYEGMIPLPHLFSISGSVGISSIRLYDFTAKFNPDLLLPITINGFYGHTHKAHIGFGQLISNIVRANPVNGASDREIKSHTHFVLGYRYQKPEGKLVLGISYTPIVEFHKALRHWGGLTVGYVL